MTIKSHLAAINELVHRHLPQLKFIRLTTTQWWIVLLIAYVVLGFTWAWSIMWPHLGRYFTPDSYAYFLLGKNFFDGHGISTFAIRDLHDVPAWPLPSRSFPPLLPLLTGTVHTITGMGIQAGVAVNLFVLAATLVAVCFLCRVLDKRYWLLLALSFFVFFATNPHYRSEVTGARSIPLTMLAYFIFIIAFLKSIDKGNSRPYFESLAGISLGLLILARFDQLLFSLAAPVFAFFTYSLYGYTKREVWIKTGYLVGFFILSYLPWGIRNMVLFGTPFAANNTLTALSIFTGHAPICFWAEQNFPKTVFDDPLAWFELRWRFTVRNWRAIGNVTHHLSYIVPLFTIAFWRHLPKLHRVLILLTAMHSIIHFSSVSLTPFPDVRYWSQVHFTLCLVFGLSLLAGLKLSQLSRLRVSIIGLCIVVFCCLPIDGKSVFADFGKRVSNGKLIPHNMKHLARGYQNMIDYYAPHVDIKNAVISPARYSEVFSYFTGVKSVMYPHNFRGNLGNSPDFIAWLKKWKIDYIQVDKPVEGRVKPFTSARFIAVKHPGHMLIDAKKILAAHEKKLAEKTPHTPQIENQKDNRK